MFSKRNIIRSVFFLGCIFMSLLISTNVFAEKKNELEKEEELKFSIASLKESANKVRLENKKLNEAIKKIPNDISKLRQELKDIDKKKISLMSEISKLGNKVKEEKREISFSRTGMDRLKNEFAALAREEKEIQNQLKLKKNQAEKFNEDMAAVRKHIVTLENKVSLTSNDERIRLLKEEEQRLEDLILESDFALELLNDDLIQARKKNSKPFEEVEELQRQQDLLNQKNIISKDEYEIALAEAAKLVNEIEETKEINNAKLEKLIEEIVFLRKRQEDLRSILNVAKRKLSGKRIDIASSQEGQVQLEKSLSIFNKEKDDLNSELLFLEDQLKELKKE